MIAAVVVVGGLAAVGVFNPKSSGGSSPQYAVTFTESGLAVGTSWTVTLNGASHSSTTGTIAFSQSNGTYSYTVSATGYTAVPASGMLTVKGLPLSQAIAFTKVATFSVEFSESGLAAGTNWTVTLGGTPQSSTTSTISIPEPNGTYTYSVGSVAGYTVSPSSGSVTVAGQAKSVAVTFTALPPSTYSVTFTQAGLPSGTTWSVTLDGATQSGSGSSIAFSEQNGTYSYTVGSVMGYTAVPSSGSVTVAGQAKTVPVAFTAVAPSTYSVTFTESGLPSGTSWSVTLNGATQSGSGTSIAFTEQNGTYDYDVGSVSGYTASPSSGSVTVAGQAKTVAVTFTPITPGTYSVTFTESGLPSGTSWSVTLNSAEQTGSGSSIVFTEQNGTYGYTVGSVSGYTVSPSSGSVTVAGQAKAVGVTFTAVAPSTYSVTFTESGLPSATTWSISLNGSAKFGAGTSLVFTGLANGTYPYAVGSVSGYSPTPSSGTVMVAGAAEGVEITFTSSMPGEAYPVTFAETGLPANTLWSVESVLGILTSAEIFFGESSTGASIEYAIPNGAYFWLAPDVTNASGSMFVPTPAYGNITVNGGPLNIPIVFTLYTPPPPPYTVTFSESGLTSGTTWSVTLNGVLESGSGSSIVFSGLSNGTYPFTVGAVSGYTASPSSGDAFVSGGDDVESITFTAAVTTFAVTFTETGLSAESFWTVTMDSGSMSNLAGLPITFNVPNGAYPFTVSASGYTASPESGTVTVSGTPVSKMIEFTQTPAFPVTFTETGLPPGTSWAVDLYANGELSNFNENISFTTTLQLSVPNGYYSWVVYAALLGATNYTATPMTGSLVVSGHSLSESVTFVLAPGELWLEFAEYGYLILGTGGLPNGTSWSVTVGGVTQTTAGMFLYFAEPGGSYTYTITAPSGFIAIPSSGTVAGVIDPAGFSLEGSSVYVAFESGGGASPASVLGTLTGAGLSGAAYGSMVAAARER